MSTWLAGSSSAGTVFIPKQFSSHELHNVFTVLEAISVSTIAFRITLICLKDIFTKVIMQDERLTRSLVNTTLAQKDHAIGNPMVKLLIKVLTNLEKRLNTVQIALVFVFPGAILGLTDIGLIASNGYIPNALTTSEECQNAIRQGGFFKSAFYFYYGFLALLAVFTLVQMKDNFSIGREIRGMLVLAIFMTVLSNFTLDFTLFSILLVQSRAWICVVGMFIIPSLMTIQLVFPLYLSKKHLKSLALEKGRSNDSGNEDKISSPKSPKEELLLLLSSNVGRNLFMEYLESEFSVENLFFVEAAEEFKTKDIYKGFEQSTSAALRIRDLFISTSSTHCVNISYNTRLTIMKKLQGVEVLIQQRMMRKRSLDTVNSNGSSVPLVDSQRLQSLDLDLVADLFEVAREEIITMMSKDTFIRFKFTRPYKEFKLQI
jgi:hypothetical protein